MKLKFYEVYNPYTKKRYWYTQRDAEGRCAEIRKKDNGDLVLLICDSYKSTHKTLQAAMDESKKYVGAHIVNH